MKKFKDGFYCKYGSDYYLLVEEKLIFLSYNSSGKFKSKDEKLGFCVENINMLDMLRRAEYLGSSFEEASLKVSINKLKWGFAVV
jgi:hypothetical protein